MCITKIKIGLVLQFMCLDVYHLLISAQTVPAIEFNLASYDRNNETTFVLKQFHQICSKNVWYPIKINNINEIGFLILQIHSFAENLTLKSNDNDLDVVEGSNIGLVYAHSSATANFSLKWTDNFEINKTCITVLPIVTVYDANDPIPGGCNLSFDTELAPYQLVSSTKDVVAVSFQPPSAYGLICDDIDTYKNLKIEMYHIFLDQYDFTIDSYFEGIIKMLTVKNIITHGTKVPRLSGMNMCTKLFSAYRGTGEIFGIIATYNGRMSAYVPAVSYACDVHGEDCMEPVIHLPYGLPATLLIFGLGICFCGHLILPLTMFFMGSMGGSFITYIISGNTGYATESNITVPIIVGITVGIIWIIMWVSYGTRISSVLSYLLTGALFASQIMNAGLADQKALHYSLNFWLAYICILLLFAFLLLIQMITFGHMLACSVLGSYTIIAVFNYYFRGDIIYQIINILRRATVKDFNQAVIDPPFHSIDGMYLASWFILIVLGVFTQLKLKTKLLGGYQAL